MGELGAMLHRNLRGGDKNPGSNNKYTKFSQFIIRKIINSIATRCHILRLKCTKFDSSWGSVPEPTGGAYSAPIHILTGFKGPYTSKKMDWRGREGKEVDGM